METLLTYLPSAGTIAAVALALVLTQRFLEREGRAAGYGFRNQLVMLSLTAIGLLLVILVLPISDVLRGQLLSLIGIVVSAAIALSSTTVLGNAMAGVMLRAIRSFRMGDFIRVADHFGRVSGRGLFHTEIQTEERRLVTLPNLYLVTHPVTTVRTSGTIVSASVSLGYDVPRERIEESLLGAAKASGLTDPFVHVLELGDFSATYRISGLLAEVKQLISTRSRLRGAVMDSLHHAGIEIVSPNFMNTRALEPGRAVIPERSRPSRKAAPAAGPEELVFDKAEEAESLETMRIARKRVAAERDARKKALEEIKEEGPDKEKAARDMELLERRLERMDAVIAGREAEAKGKE